MLTLPCRILALTTLTFAHPFSLNPPPHLQSHEQLQGSCSTTHLPTEEQYTLGYQTFCNTYVAADTANYLREGNPLVATFNLTAYDQKIVRWVYKIDVHNNTLLNPLYELDRETCIEKFRSILETADAGGLGKAYCVVDRTGGKSAVLVTGGTLKENTVYWQSRERLDD